MHHLACLFVVRLTRPCHSGISASCCDAFLYEPYRVIHGSSSPHIRSKNWRRSPMHLALYGPKVKPGEHHVGPRRGRRRLVTACAVPRRGPRGVARAALTAASKGAGLSSPAAATTRRKPRWPASSPAWASSSDFPVPGSPSTSKTWPWPWPCCVLSSSPRTVSNSAPRPRIGLAPLGPLWSATASPRQVRYHDPPRHGTPEYLR